MSDVPPQLRSTNSSCAELENCECCGKLAKLLADQEHAVAELGQQLAGLQIQLRRAGQAEVAARNELRAAREEEPEADDVREAMHLWRDEVMGGNKRHKLVVSDPRGQRTKWAVKRYGKQRCHDAIMGVTLDEWAMGRDKRTDGRSFNDLAKHIFKDNETIERFEGLWLARHAPVAEAPAHQPARAAHPDPVPRIIDALEGVRQVEAGKWTARCPAHEDRNASLSVADGRSGVVMTCHAGCTNDAIAEALRIPLAEWFHPADEPALAKPKSALAKPKGALPTEEALAAYEVRLRSNQRLLERLFEVRAWTSGTLTALHVGWDGQRIVLPVRDAAGKLVNVARYLPGGSPKLLAVSGRPRDLFPAPESVPGDMIVLTEGEADAVSAHELGWPGVAIPGAAKWDAAWIARLASRRVVVVMDCDAPGRDAASRIARHLAGHVVELRVIDLALDRTDGYDLTDFLMGGGGVRALNELAAAATPVHSMGRAA